MTNSEVTTWPRCNRHCRHLHQQTCGELHHTVRVLRAVYLIGQAVCHTDPPTLQGAHREFRGRLPLHRQRTGLHFNGRCKNTRKIVKHSLNLHGMNQHSR